MGRRWTTTPLRSSVAKELREIFHQTSLALVLLRASLRSLLHHSAGSESVPMGSKRRPTRRANVSPTATKATSEPADEFHHDAVYTSVPSSITIPMTYTELRPRSLVAASLHAQATCAFRPRVRKMGRFNLNDRRACRRLYAITPSCDDACGRKYAGINEKLE